MQNENDKFKILRASWWREHSFKYVLAGSEASLGRTVVETVGMAYDEPGRHRLILKNCSL